MKLTVRRLNICVSILPSTDYVLQLEVSGEGSKLKLWLVLFFQKGEHFCLFTISTDVSLTTTYEIGQAFGSVCCSGGIGGH